MNYDTMTREDLVNMSEEERKKVPSHVINRLWNEFLEDHYEKYPMPEPEIDVVLYDWLSVFIYSLLKYGLIVL